MGWILRYLKNTGVDLIKDIADHIQIISLQEELDVMERRKKRFENIETRASLLLSNLERRFMFDEFNKATLIKDYVNDDKKDGRKFDPSTILEYCHRRIVMDRYLCHFGFSYISDQIEVAYQEFINKNTPTRPNQAA